MKLWMPCGFHGASLWIAGDCVVESLCDQWRPPILTSANTIHRVCTKEKLPLICRNSSVFAYTVPTVTKRASQLPPDVEVRRSARRRRTVTAYRENGRTIVLVPARMGQREIARYVDDLVKRLDARRPLQDDEELRERARMLSEKFLQGMAIPSNVRWVSNQRRRWGSCTPVDATIRLSSRMQGMPDFVIDYVLLHELVHLLEAGHGPEFERWMKDFPQLHEARAFLEGASFAEQNFLPQAPEELGQTQLF